jgi:integrase
MTLRPPVRRSSSTSALIVLRYRPTAAARGRQLARAGDINRPYDLRHSAAWLWLHEGINPVQVARWMGHDVSETYKTYAHVIDDLDPGERESAELVIQRVRKDMVRTWTGVQQRLKQSKPTRKKSSTRARSAA